jgi:two-component system NarL family response regulator
LDKTIRLFIVDDNRLLREGLSAMLSEVEDIQIVGTASSGSEALKAIKSVKPDVALIDIGLPDKDGIEVTQDLHVSAPDVRIIILGMIDLTEEILACIEAGASGYILKESTFDHLVDIIRSVQRSESFCSPKVTASLFTRIAELSYNRLARDMETLTNRELEIINLIAKQMSNKQISEKLFISTQTVKNHIHNVLDKLQLHGRLEAVQYARERNLLNKK